MYVRLKYIAKWKAVPRMTITCADNHRTYVEVVANILRSGGKEVNAVWGEDCELAVLNSEPEMVVAILARERGALGDPIENFDAEIAGVRLCRSLQHLCDQANIPLVIAGFGLVEKELPAGFPHAAFLRLACDSNDFEQLVVQKIGASQWLEHQPL